MPSNWFQVSGFKFQVWRNLASHLKLETSQLETGRIAAAALAVAGHAGILATAEVDAWRPLLPAAAGLAMAGMIWAWRQKEDSLGWILGGALVLRLILFWLSPAALSDDVFRFLWDGWLTTHGLTPFDSTPNEIAAAGAVLRPDLLASMNSPDFHSVYPPVSQLIFAAASATGERFEVTTLKLLLGGCELVALLALSRVVPARQLVLYAWNPLVVVETWGQIHTEAALLAALGVTLWFTRKRWTVAASAALTVGIWVKLWPVLLLPFLLREFRWRILAITTVFVVSALLWLPFLSPEAAPNILKSLQLYVGTFEFNAGVYYLIKWLFAGFIYGFESIPDRDPRPSVGLILRIAMLIGLAWIFWKGRTWPIERQIGAVIIVFLLSLPTIHPWYFLPLMLVLPGVDEIRWNWIWLSLCAFGTYLLYTHGAPWYWTFVALGWIGWAGLWIGGWAARLNAKGVPY